jgi:hypothetical protein
MNIRAKLIAAATLPVFLSGCMASFGGASYTRSDRVEAELAYYQAQAALQQREPQPLVEIIAQPGQSITGLASVRVYQPQQQHSQQMQQYQQHVHPAWALAGQVANTVLPILGTGYASYKLAETIGTSIAGVARDVTVVTQPAPTIVPSPAPVIVPQPPPIVVTQPAPIIVDPVIVQP